MICPNCDGKNLNCIHNKVWSIENGKVYRCLHCDLNFINPMMSDEEERIFYNNFNNRVKNRGVTDKVSIQEYHQKSLKIAQERLNVVSKYFKDNSKVLEIGSSTGAFLSILKNCHTSAVEIVEDNREYSKQFVTGDVYMSLDDVPKYFKFDIICMFHVFEHIKNPHNLLNQCKNLLTDGGIILIEVPHIEDPLMSIYALEEFKDFIFQPMHPMIYSVKSLDYIFDSCNYYTKEVIYYQRYGLGNHLSWLTYKKPGGNSVLLDMFENNDMYKKTLEINAQTDTLFYIAQKKLALSQEKDQVCRRKY